jgi:adenine-specific DNA-methyltransferase
MPLLNWLNDDEARKISARVPYRLLQHDPSLSSPHFRTPENGGTEGGGNDSGENMLIHGDNLEALKALLPYYAGQVKCIYIDPPYNTQSAFEHYDDNLEHSTWLSMMYPRLELLRDLLAEDGSIWVTLDDNELAYFKVIADEIFGRDNFVSIVVWQKKVSPANDALWFSGDHDYILVYAKKKLIWRPNRLPRNDEQTKYYTNPDDDIRGPWNSAAYTCAKSADERPNLYYPITNPNTHEVIWPKRTRVWAFGQETHEKNVQEGLVYWGKDGKGKMPRFKKFLGGRNVVPRSVWSYNEAGHTQEARLEGLKLFGENPFSTPKPEKLMQRILLCATNPGDLVLDSFLGSGTTAAVAHKMGRRYIGIEMGEHAVTHCVPRLQKVVAGEQGGISQEVGWQGGGGFRFYRLGETIFDEHGAINPAVKFAALAAHVWFSETHTPLPPAPPSSLPPNSPVLGIWGELEGGPLLGIHHETAYYLLYNGILGDKRPEAGNVLTARVLEALPPHPGPKVIYGELTTLNAERLKQESITFKQVPYDIKAR